METWALTLLLGFVGSGSRSTGGEGERITESCLPYAGETTRLTSSVEICLSEPCGKDGSSGCVLGTNEGRGDESLGDALWIEGTLVS
jgi:hypothetical protein